MGMGKMMKQMQKLQNDMARLQEELAEKEVSASSGGGAVTVTVTGDNQVVDVQLDPDILDPEETEMLQDLIIAATNEALRQAREMVAEEMGKLTGGLNLPPGLF